MVDVNDRLRAKGANVILQPEAFSAWGYAAGAVVARRLQGGRLREPAEAARVRRQREREHDRQSLRRHLRRAERRDRPQAKAAPGRSSAGTRGSARIPTPGSSRWRRGSSPDPGDRQPGLGARARGARRSWPRASRCCRAPACRAPARSPPAPCENGYREAIVFADVDVPDGPSTAPVDPVRAAPPRFRCERAGERRRAGVAASRSTRRASPPRARACTSSGTRTTGGLRERLPRRQPRRRRHIRRAGPRQRQRARRGRGAEPGDRRAREPGRSSPGRSSPPAATTTRGRIMLARFDARGRKLRPACARRRRRRQRQVAAGVAVVRPRPARGVDRRARRRPRGRAARARLRGPRRRAAGDAFGPAVRVDAGTPVRRSRSTTTTSGRPRSPRSASTVYVAWADFRNYNWDIFLARSDDGGATLGSNVRVDDFPDLERLNERPAHRRSTAAAPVHVALDRSARARARHQHLLRAQRRPRRHLLAERASSTTRRSASTPTPTRRRNQWHPALAVDGDRLFVAWQDDRLGNNDIFFTLQQRRRRPRSRPPSASTTPARAQRADAAAARRRRPRRAADAATSCGRTTAAARATCTWRAGAAGVDPRPLARPQRHPMIDFTFPARRRGRPRFACASS